MARHQLGKELDDKEVHLITRWLDSLTGQIPRADIELDEASARSCWSPDTQENCDPPQPAAGITSPWTAMDAQKTVALEAELDALQKEVQRLRSRVAELEEAGRGFPERLLDALPSLVYVLDLDEGRYVYRNRELTDLVGEGGGAAAGSPRGDGLSPIVHPDDIGRIEEYRARVAASESGEQATVEYRVRGRDGGWRWFLERGVALGREGPGRRMLGSAHDITPRKHTEQMLERSESLLHAFLEYTPSMMVAVDAAGRLLLVNREIESFYKMSREELLGRVVYDLLPAPAAASIRKANEEVAAAGRPGASEQVLVYPNGPRTYLSTKFPIRDAEGKIYAVGTISVDISRAKQAEAERAEMQRRLIEMQQATIQELITPLLPLARGVVAMPIVGSVDPARAEQILTTLLEGIAAQQARIAILDITGVKVVDERVAQSFVDAARAAGLLGTRVVLTGIKPQIAQTLTTIGADLSGIVTKGTLESGIAYALGRRLRW
ncbi:PAS domain-containing protein [Sorangium sp. So ce1504]|uniref:PAS domain-containing protein n=1 Tax=Sorangium sp. So ce1504 TaxID=3133337 RepID=UPI003F5E5007